MATQLFSNNAETSVGAQMAAASTTLTVAAGTGGLFTSPTNGDYELVTLTRGGQYEIMKMTARSGDNMTVARGQEGTTPLQWEIGEMVSGRLTRDTIAQIQQESANAAAAAAVAVATVGSLPPPYYDMGDRAVDFSIDLSLGTTIRVRVTANVTITFTNPVEGVANRIVIVQDAVGGHAVTLAGISKWLDGLGPMLTTLANKTDMLGLVSVPTTDPNSSDILGVSYALNI